jgi:hypothetical protein
LPGLAGSDRCGCSDSVALVQLRLLELELFSADLLSSDPPPEASPGAWDRAAVTMGGRPTLFLDGGVSQGSPRELLLPWDCCHAGAYVTRRSCLVLAPGADRGHGMDGRHPGAPSAEPDSTIC